MDTVGVFRPVGAGFFLTNQPAGGRADVTIAFGSTGDLPVVGDWDGDGVDTVGVYRTGTFFLRNTNTSGESDRITWLGQAGDVPLAGHWK